MPTDNVVQASSEVETSNLNDDEMSALDRAYARLLQDVRTEGSNVLQDKLGDYRSEIEFGASVAKAQFQQNLGGGSTSAGKFAVSRIDPGFFGWDTWDNAADASADTVTTWLDSDNPDNLTGTDEEPIIVGEEAVHVIVGIGERSSSPVEDKFKFEVNREPKTVVRTENEFRDTDLKLKLLDTPYVLYEDTEFFAEYYSGVAGPVAPYLFGVSFVEGKAARRVNPDNYTGTQTANNIVVQQ